MISELANLILVFVLGAAAGIYTIVLIADWLDRQENKNEKDKILLYTERKEARGQVYGCLERWSTGNYCRD